MKKIWLVAGVIICCVLLLSGWLFIKDFGGFAHFLGEESKKIIGDESDSFIGTWDIENEEQHLIFFSNGTISGYMNGDYEIEDDKIFFNIVSTDDTGIYEYSYYFSNNDKTLVLSNVNTGLDLILHKS